jgi:hypothetical protein
MSDIHLNHENNGALSSILRDELPKYLEKNDVKVDNLFITGDFRDAAYISEKNKEELKDTAKSVVTYIKDIARVVSVKDEDIHLVPGNHDLERSADDVNIVKEIEKQYTKTTDTFNKIKKDFFVNRFSFFYMICSEIYGSVNNWSDNIHYLDSKKEINIVHLNSALICHRKRNQGNMILGSALLYEMFKGFEYSEKPFFVLAHHEFEELKKDDWKFLQSQIRNNTIYYLCGHFHEPSAEFSIGDNVYKIVVGSTKYSDDIKPVVCLGDCDKKGLLTMLLFLKYNNRKWKVDAESNETTVCNYWKSFFNPYCLHNSSDIDVNGENIDLFYSKLTFIVNTKKIDDEFQVEYYKMKLMYLFNDGKIFQEIFKALDSNYENKLFSLEIKNILEKKWEKRRDSNDLEFDKIFQEETLTEKLQEGILKLWKISCKNKIVDIIEKYSIKVDFNNNIYYSLSNQISNALEAIDSWIKSEKTMILSGEKGSGKSVLLEYVLYSNWNKDKNHIWIKIDCESIVNLEEAINIKAPCKYSDKKYIILLDNFTLNLVKELDRIEKRKDKLRILIICDNEQKNQLVSRNTDEQEPYYENLEYNGFEREDSLEFLKIRKKYLYELFLCEPSIRLLGAIEVPDFLNVICNLKVKYNSKNIINSIEAYLNEKYSFFLTDNDISEMVFLKDSLIKKVRLLEDNEKNEESNIDENNSVIEIKLESNLELVENFMEKKFLILFLYKYYNSYYFHNRFIGNYFLYRYALYSYNKSKNKDAAKFLYYNSELYNSLAEDDKSYIINNVIEKNYNSEGSNMNQFKYEVALSYSHKDEEAANLISNELEYIFADRIFQDYLRPEELVDANVFRETLKRIFQESRYAVILYSPNYEKGNFTKIELEEVLNIAKSTGENNFCIINYSDKLIKNESLKHLFYMDLKGEEKVKLQEQISEIVMNLKKSQLLKTIKQEKLEGIYRLNVQTLFMYGNLAQWKHNYNWNILTKKFIEAKGRKIADEYSWKDLWKYIEEDFLLIKRELNKMPEIEREIFLNCHLSIAYKLGQLYGDLGKGSGNRNLTLISSNRQSNLIFKIPKEPQKQEPAIEITCISEPGNDETSVDIVCIISLKPLKNKDVMGQVKKSLSRAEKKYHTIYLFQEEITVAGGAQLEGIAEYLIEKMLELRMNDNGDNYNIHLFLDTLAPLAFVMGGRALFPGEIYLYEFIDTEENYIASLSKNL